MKIREFNISDQDDVVNLWKECQLTVPWNDPYKDIQRKVKVDPDLFLVGEISGVIVATVMGGYDGHRGWINYLAVSPSHRRKGYACMIMKKVEGQLKQKGCPKINLQVRESNIDIIAFYEAIGYGNDKVIGLGKRLENDN
ncbi:MAG: GNAT family acetyltransferase [Deltaproteobacteria bacterium]|nr:GNAT family acetyltransferase [Deltaproteobacteria bacterium]MBT4266930.1 GNAT family acetyltransferase [Deltaproteobacteria bacterium]MBT4642975.1 GNAT family acetyltransferase [Deltaproteobacteria bacterium]MBT7891578.1 GNAT family acetyltransferase [Deltaproteobacteria bacterium]